MKLKNAVVRTETIEKFFYRLDQIDTLSLQAMDTLLCFLRLDMESDEDYDIVRLYQSKIIQTLTSRECWDSSRIKILLLSERFAQIKCIGE